MPETVVVLTKKEFMRKLKERRLLEVAKGSGVSYPTLRRMLKGESDIINLTVRKKVTDFLGVENG
tara:strand:+ start:432 stop:626 length:195 start_codon:yes stop_codon:yes gene_type:complete